MFRLNIRVTRCDWVKFGTGELGVASSTSVSTNGKTHESQNATLKLFLFLFVLPDYLHTGNRYVTVILTTFTEAKIVFKL